jgi:arylsulfatase A-like enzyme
MSRFVPALLVGLLGTSCASEERFNILLISLDTLRADHLTLYGYERDTSPHLKSLAEQGVVFDHAFSQSPKTATSHMTLFTGLYPSVHGIENLSEQNRRLSEEIPTLATLLSRAGYQTEAVVGGGNVAGELGFDQGFELYAGSADAEDMFRQAHQVLDRVTGDERPFFVFLHTYEVHDPYVPREEYARMYVDPDYAGEIIGSLDELIEQAGGQEYWRQYNAYWSRVDPQSAADAQHLRDLYDAEIRFTDEALAAFVARLEDEGFFEDTIVVVLSDHGEEFFEHGAVLHNTLYQEVLQVPLVFLLPAELGIDAGQRIEAIVRLIDVKPTLLELAGVELPEHLQGRSLVPLMRGAKEESRPVFSERIKGERRFALQSGRWKYIRKPGGEELYDLERDPGEQHNVAAQHEPLLRDLRHQMGQLLQRNEGLARELQAGEVFDLDQETREQLEALGYLGQP